MKVSGSSAPVVIPCEAEYLGTNRYTIPSYQLIFMKNINIWKLLQLDCCSDSTKLNY